MFSHLVVGFIAFGLALIFTDWRYSRRLKSEAERVMIGIMQRSIGTTSS